MDTQAEEEDSAIPIAEEKMPAFGNPTSNVPCSETAENNMSKATSGSRRRRRRSSGEELPTSLTDLVRGLGEFIHLASTTLSTSLDRLTNELNMVERNMVERKERLFGDLMKVQGLTEAEVIRANIVIGRDHSLLVQFPSISNEVKAAWIKAVIQ